MPNIELEPQGDPNNLTLPLGLQSVLLPPSQLGAIKPRPAPKPAPTKSVPGVQVQVDKPVASAAGPIQPGAAAVPHPTPTPTPTLGAGAPAAPAPAPTAQAQAQAQPAEDPLQAQLQDPETVNLLAETMAREGNTPRMQQAIMESIFNRARISGQSIKQVITEPGQFTSMDQGVPGGYDTQAPRSPQEIATAKAVIAKPNPAWRIPPTVTHFYDTKAQAAERAKHPEKYPAQPGFAKGQPALTIGTTNFYAGDFPHTGKGVAPTPGGAAPTDTDRYMAMAEKFLTPTPEALKQIQEDERQAHYWMEQGIKAQGAVGQVYDQELTAIADDRKHVNELWDRYRANTDKLMEAFPDRKKMEEDELRKVSSEPRDPSRVLGQFLPMLAILGGAFTKAGAIGSLKAAGAAMTAAREHDDQALKRADDEYHDAITETMDRASLVHQELTEGLTAAQDDMNAVLQFGQVYGAKANIPFLIAAAYQKDPESIMAAPMMIGKAFAEIATMQRQKLQDTEMQLRIQTMQQNFTSGGPAKPYVNLDNGNAIYFHPKAPPGQAWTDETGQPLIPQPTRIGQIQTGRLYSGESAYVNTLVNEKERAGAGPLTGSELLAAHNAYAQVNRAQAIMAGPFGQQVQSMNNVIGHLQMLDGIAQALENGDIRIFNGLAQTLALETGQPAPTNFVEAKNIVGDEVVKAIVSGGGSLADRQSAQDAFNVLNSPEQNEQATMIARSMLLRQLGDMRIRYDAMGQARPFTDYLNKDVAILLPGASEAATTSPSGVQLYGAGGKPLPLEGGAPGAAPTQPARSAPTATDKSAFQGEETQALEAVKKGIWPAAKAVAQLKLDFPWVDPAIIDARFKGL